MYPLTELLARRLRASVVAPCFKVARQLQGVVWLFALSLGMSGCHSAQKSYIVDTRSGSNPLIESPYQSDDGFLRIPIPAVGLSCKSTTVSFMGGSITLSTERSDQASYFSSTRSVIAKISRRDARSFADSAANNKLDDLRQALDRKNQPCTLTPDCPDGACPPAAIAAESILRHLPRYYSAVLRDRYNHRVWTANGASHGVSFDLTAGMRLRIENSLPISPAGLGARNAYPSSFAAPTYIYIHALTGAEICYTDTPVSATTDDFVCNANAVPQSSAKDKESDRFLSLSSGMARWGTRQVDQTLAARPLIADPTEALPVVAERRRLQTAIDAASRDATAIDISFDRKSIEDVLALPRRPPTTNMAEDASGLIDLLEDSNETVGARKYWRLWIPMSRATLRTGSLPINQPGGGSVEGDGPLPMLISADSLRALNRHNYNTNMPCEQDPPETTCHQLRYRAVPIPEILVQVNREERWVPVGSTLLDLVAHKLHTAIAAVHFTAGREVPDETESIQAAQVASHAAQRALAAGLKVSRMFEGERVEVSPSSLLSPVEVDRFLRLQIAAGDEIQWK